MSAIAGIYYPQGRSVDRSDLERMVDILVHRGPDARGVWSDGVVGLGNRVLWTTPESLRERPPAESGGLVVTADARLDNRGHLLDEVGPPAMSRDSTDSELILAAYRKWGGRCVEHLLGDFAFAIWDSRAKALFCARDHFGVKPFCYYAAPGVFAFASEIKALHRLPEVPRRLDEERVADYLTSTSDDVSSTFYADIRRLPPAHSLTVTAQGTRLGAYWSLNPTRELKLGSDQDYAEGFREIFSDAVSCRLRSAYPIGSFLSGGLDSSAVTCMARNELRRRGDARLTTFSAIFDDVVECDERPYIEAVHAQNGVDAHFVQGDRLSPLGDNDRVLWHQDEPLFAFNLFINRGLYSAAAERGVRVMLDGFDGDTVVSHGAGYMTELAVADRWWTLAGEVRGFARNFGRSPWSLMWRYLWDYAIEPRVLRRRPIRPVWRRLRRSQTAHSADSTGGICRAEFTQRLDLHGRMRRARRQRPVTEREHHYRALTWGVMPHTLEVLDRTAAAFSVEPRYPFWDKRLVEYCLSLPPQQKMRRGWTRFVMRQGMSGILPREIQWRRGKSNLGPNFEHTLAMFERERLDGVILNGCQAGEEYLDAEAVRDAYRRFVNRPDAVNSVAVWKAANLALWLQHSGVKP